MQPQLKSIGFSALAFIDPSNRLDLSCENLVFSKHFVSDKGFPETKFSSASKFALFPPFSPFFVLPIPTLLPLEPKGKRRKG
jgi:hypothetical protein